MSTSLECSSVLASGIMGTPWEVAAAEYVLSGAGGNVTLHPENVVHLLGSARERNLTECQWDLEYSDTSANEWPC